MQKQNAKAKTKKVNQKTVPVAYSSQIKARAPKISRSSKSDGRITITNREMITPMIAHAAFTEVVDLKINPGLPGTFPWLSTIANNFETYRFESLKFEYIPACPTSGLGSYMMAIDYDVLDTFPSSQMYLMGTHGAVMGSVWEHISCYGEKDSLKKFNERYTRKGTRTVNDQKTYDVGSLFIGTQGGIGVYTGSLFVEYTVTLMSPQLRSSTSDDCVKVSNTIGLSADQPFGTVADVAAAGGLNCFVSDVDKITFQDVGEYSLNYEAIGTGLTGLASTFSLFAGLGSISALSYLANNAQTAADYLYRVKVDQPGSVFRFTNIPATTIASMVARVGAYAYSLA